MAVNRNDAHLHLGAFYFFYFASLGAFIPYWGLYLSDRGYSAQMIGLLTALLMVTKIIAPYLWGWIADHLGIRLTIIRFGALLSAILFGLVFLASDAIQIALVIAGFSFFWNAVLPQFEVITMIHLGDATHYYSRIRLWGSIGFIVSSIGLAFAISYWGIGVFPVFVLLLLVFLWLDTLLLVHADEACPSITKESIWRSCFQWPVIGLLLACFLGQMSHGPYYAFFSLYLEQQQYPRSSIGAIWSLGVAAEIVVFMVVHRWLLEWGANRLLAIALLLSAIRWALLALYANHWPVLVVVQLLHAASFGLFHSAAIHLIDRYFRGALRGRGQALYSSISFGLGGAAGAVASGYIWADFGGQWLYLLASLVALLGLIQFLAAGRFSFRYN